MEDQNKKLEEPDLTGTYTAREYISWKTERLLELIRGKVFMITPAPLRLHQQILMNLGSLLHVHFQKQCQVYPAPFDVYLIHSGEDWKETKNIVQPDLCVICYLAKLHDRGCMGAPDLVVEILSPRTAAKDLGLKRDLYEEYGVKELWIIHPQDATVAIHVLENGSYKILPLVAKGQNFQSPSFPDLKLDLNEVFPQWEHDTES